MHDICFLVIIPCQKLKSFNELDMDCTKGITACVSSRGAQSTELVWILDFKQILLLLCTIH